MRRHFWLLKTQDVGSQHDDLMLLRYGSSIKLFRDALGNHFRAMLPRGRWATSGWWYQLVWMGVDGLLN